MGNLCSGSNTKKKKGSLIRIKSQNDNNYYKPKKNSNNLLCFDPEKKVLREESLELKSPMKDGCMFTKLGPCLYICIGGIDTQESSFLIHLNEKKISMLPSPPFPIGYGHLNKYKDKIYVIGTLDLTSKKGAVPLTFDLKTKKWADLPPMPVNVSLSGSYIVHTFLYLLGGYLNYPDSPEPFSSLLIFDILSESWVTSKIITPIYYGLPNCTVLPSFDVLIVGGHDSGKISNDRSKKVFLFNCKSFEQCADVPEVGELHFYEDAMHFRSEVLFYSDDDILFVYNIDKDSWNVQHIEEKIIKKDSRSLKNNQI